MCAKMRTNETIAILAWMGGVRVFVRSLFRSLCANKSSVIRSCVSTHSRNRTDPGPDRPCHCVILLVAEAAAEEAAVAAPVSEAVAEWWAAVVAAFIIISRRRASAVVRRRWPRRWAASPSVAGLRAPLSRRVGRRCRVRRTGACIAAFRRPAQSPAGVPRAAPRHCVSRPHRDTDTTTTQQIQKTRAHTHTRKHARTTQ